MKKYEDLVIPILHKYGIEILLRVHLANSTFSFADKEKPSEVLVLSVPSQEAMNAYFKDPHRLALKEKYGHVIKQIKMFRGKEA